MVDFVFNSFVTLMVVVDPLGLAPIFAALPQGYSEKRKREAAIRGTVLGAAILLVFALVGDGLLGALSIGLPAFRTAGGILLLLLALDMIFDRPTGLRSRTVRDQEEDEYNQDISVFPGGWKHQADRDSCVRPPRCTAPHPGLPPSRSPHYEALRGDRRRRPLPGARRPPRSPRRAVCH